MLLAVLHHRLATSKIFQIAFSIGLSWFFALCSQVIIPLPFNLVPLSLQPAPLIVTTVLFGPHAINAYLLYLLQGACGLPFFAGLQGGIARLLGPTGGYLIGFLFAMLLVNRLKVWATSSAAKLFAVYQLANGIVFCCGLAQLAWFVPAGAVLSAGLYPFLVGDFIIKTLFVTGLLALGRDRK